MAHRFLKFLSALITLPLAVLFLLLAISNQQAITLSLFPFVDTMAMPLFIPLLSALIIGFLCGGLVVGAATMRLRFAARRTQKQAEKLIARTAADAAAAKTSTPPPALFTPPTV